MAEHPGSWPPESDTWWIENEFLLEVLTVPRAPERIHDNDLAPAQVFGPSFVQVTPQPQISERILCPFSDGNQRAI